jgi:hypothetical protein
MENAMKKSLKNETADFRKKETSGQGADGEFHLPSGLRRIK